MLSNNVAVLYPKQVLAVYIPKSRFRSFFLSRLFSTKHNSDMNEALYNIPSHKKCMYLDRYMQSLSLFRSFFFVHSLHAMGCVHSGTLKQTRIIHMFVGMHKEATPVWICYPTHIVFNFDSWHIFVRFTEKGSKFCLDIINKSSFEGFSWFNVNIQIIGCHPTIFMFKNILTSTHFINWYVSTISHLLSGRKNRRYIDQVLRRKYQV